MTTTRRVPLLGSVIVAVLGVVAACGGDDDDDTSEASADSSRIATEVATTDQARGEPVKVTYAVATQDLNVGYPFATLPLGLGFFEEEGLDVEIVPGESSATTIQLMLTGKVDVGVAVPDAAIVQRVSNDVPVKTFYPVSRRNAFQVIVNPDSPIREFADLEGKTLGIHDLGSGGDVYISARIRTEQLDPDSIEKIVTGYGAAAAEALKNGDVDAGTTFSAEKARLAAEGYEFRELPPAEFQDRMYSYNLMATDSYIEQNPDILAKLGRATAKATVFLATNPEAAVQIFWCQYPERAPADRSDEAALAKDLAILQGQLHDMRVTDLPIDFAWGSQDAEAWAFHQTFLRDAGLIDREIDPTAFFFDGVQDQYLEFNLREIVDMAESWEPGRCEQP